ncbi:transposase [Enterococcus sp. DIV0187]|uniref:transposase n=1 Tax=Enterococcus sp. DIV0187 TaxID=2774644 RepID=UPI003F68976F
MIHRFLYVACLDDFAVRKRQSYGSILIDAQSRKVIDLIPSRKLFDVQEWLQKFPNLTFVIRDGSHIFRRAISEVSLDIIQVADRFHVLKSLTEHATKALRSLIPKKIELDKKTKPISKQLTFAQNQKQQLMSFVREKRNEGWKYAEIARFFQLDYRTVKRYCDPTIDALEDRQ